MGGGKCPVTILAPLPAPSLPPQLPRHPLTQGRRPYLPSSTAANYLRRQNTDCVYYISPPEHNAQAHVPPRHFSSRENSAEQKDCIVTPSLIGERSIVMSVSVCLCVYADSHFTVLP